ncbi:hypothetical protein B0A48_07039 [Cryoendolithus antarcticus]|uniref:DUF6590 domain-containing protein n=1 Tax=Cryoendolithus antarcticus TaxID=1507870 RepID=A0A1V8T843_9PEZI|nr:hypothetical protein B0A48_07039 [Cryoendolithus antarcticus]
MDLTLPKSHRPGGWESSYRLYDDPDSDRDTSRLKHAPLDPSYKLRPRDFYRPGRVFMTLWTEPTAYTKLSLLSDPNTSITAFGERVYSKVRPFVVIRQATAHCICVRIISYSGQGVSKKGVNKSEHAIIYDGNGTPNPMPGEEPEGLEQPMQAIAIRILSDRSDFRLAPASRLDFGRIYTVEYNVKAKATGTVHATSMQPLIKQFKTVFLQGLLDVESHINVAEFNGNTELHTLAATATTDSSLKSLDSAPPQQDQILSDEVPALASADIKGSFGPAGTMGSSRDSLHGLLDRATTTEALRTPTVEDWQQWRPILTELRYEVPAEAIKRRMADEGLHVTSKMLRDKYRKWKLYADDRKLRSAEHSSRQESTIRQENAPG